MAIPILLRRYRFYLAASIVCLMLALIGTLGSVRAQGQDCRTVDELKFCGTLDILFPPEDPRFVLIGDNLTVGLKDGPPLVKVLPGTQGSARIVRFDFDNDGTREVVIFGSVKFINDPVTAPLVSTKAATDDSLQERLYVNTTTKEIKNDRTKTRPEVIPNSTMQLGFLDRAGIRPLFKSDAPSELQEIDFTFDLTKKEFRGRIPINLKLSNNTENPNVRIVAAVIFKENGTLTGSVGDFGMVLAGLNINLEQIVLRPGTATSSAEFEAGIVNVSKASNPALPNLDPARSDLIFQLQKLKYKDGRFSIAGGSIPLPDWVLGDTFRLTNQSISLSNDDTTKTAVFAINSTLVFGASFAAQPSTSVTIALQFKGKRVNNILKPVLEGTITQLDMSVGILSLKLKNVSLVGDTVENFFGIKSQNVDLRWPQNLGGKTAAGLTNFKLGIDKDKKLQFALGGGTIATPSPESGVFKGTNLQATIGVISSTVTFTFTGSLNINLPANSGIAPQVQLIVRAGKNVCTSTSSGLLLASSNATGEAGLVARLPVGKPVPPPPPCIKRFEASLSAFNVKLAGFALGLQSPRMLDDGGFAADTASLSLPAGLSGSAGLTVKGLRVEGDGDVTITGGGIEIPNMQIGGVSFGGFKGSFAKTPEAYEFFGKATFSIPGLEGSGTRRISADVTIKTEVSGALKELGVILTFSATPGIPIGSTGAELTTISGSFSLKQGTATFGVGITVGSTARLANIPLISLNGNANLQLNPFKLSLTSSLKVLIFEVANASIQIGHQAGFNGGTGVKVNFNITAAVINGSVNFRIGKVSGDVRIAGSASLRLGFVKNQFGLGLPPSDAILSSVSFQLGRFRNEDTNDETVGMKGAVKIVFNFTVFLDLRKRITQSGFIRFGGNAKDYELIDEVQVQQRAAAGLSGYTVRNLTPNEMARLGLPQTQATVQQVTAPVVFTDTAASYIGIHYGTGDPSISLTLPHGNVLTESNVNGITQTFLRDLSPVITKGNDLAFIFAAAEPGTYTLTVENAPVTYTIVSYQINNVPELRDVAAVRNGDDVVISWDASDSDNPDAKVTVGYSRILTATDGVVTATDDLELGNTYVITEGLPLSTGQYSWSLREVPTGEYKVVVTVNDEANAPVVAAAPLVISVVDTRPPAVPAGLSAIPQAGQLRVTWTPNAERDLAGYEIGFGVINDSSQFTYSRTIGAKEVAVLTATGLIDAQLWGIEDDQTVFYGVRAYDLSGNYSDWSPLIAAKPWAFSPKAWTPVPNSGASTFTPIEVAFNTPLLTTSLSLDALVVRDTNGQLVPGELFYLTDDLTGTEVVGLSFEPSIRLTELMTYTVTLKGGAGGITAVDGRQMGTNYTWNFTTPDELEFNIYLPLARK